MGVTSGVGTAYPSRPEFTLGCSGGSCCLNFSFLCRVL